MAIVIDATKGGAAANSYATIEEADAYLEAQYGAEEWADLTPDNKAKLLVTATRMIDGLSTLYGSLDPAQALNFPLDNTSGDGAGDGFSEAKTASIIQAFYLYQNHDGILEARQMAIQGVRSEGIGPTSKIITGFNPLRRFDSLVYKLLAFHIDLSFKLSRG
jgi:hypothetical protein